jgi:hypothetical protein
VRPFDHEEQIVLANGEKLDLLFMAPHRCDDPNDT